MPNINCKINIGGKTYSSFDEFKETAKHDPECDTIFWEDVENLTIINGKMLTPTYAKCWHKAKCYEGEVEYRGKDLYVGGEFVKKVLP